jgi:hypothetical protein
MKRIISILLFPLVLAGCANHSFVPIGMSAETLVPKPASCGAKVLLRPPKNMQYSEVGICMARAPGGGMVTDNTPMAIKELQKCACLQGGDAIVLSGANESGIIPAFGGYSQQSAKAEGIVIVFKKPSSSAQDAKQPNNP